MGRRGRRKVRDDFTFAAQARAYARVFTELTDGPYANAARATRNPPVATQT